MHLADRKVDESVGVDDFHSVLAHQFELHDHHIVLNVLQIDAIGFGSLRNLRLVDRLAVEEVLDLLLLLTFNEKPVPVVGLLVDLVEVHRVFYLDKLGDRSLLEDLLPALLLHGFVILLLLLDHLVTSSGFINCLKLIGRCTRSVEVLSQ